jgi:hypothetical protein
LQFFTPKTPAIFPSNQRLHLEYPQLQKTPRNCDAAAALELGEQYDSGRCEARIGEMAMAMLVMVWLWWKGGRERESSRREGE